MSDPFNIGPIIDVIASAGGSVAHQVTTRPPVQKWSDNEPVPPPVSLPVSRGPDIPPIPQYTGSDAKVAVNGHALQTFVKNIGLLAGPLQDALGRVHALPRLAPGAFYDSYLLYDKVENTVKPTLADGLGQILQALSDVQSMGTKMIQKYATFEDLNKMSAKDLGTAIDTTVTDFNKLVPSSAPPSQPGGTTGGTQGK